MKKENDLGRDEIGALVWRTALPSMLAQFVSVLYSIVDRMYIGHIAGVGETALAGVGVCGPVVTMVGSAAVWISWGASPLMGIRMGEGRPEEARRILRTGFCMLLAFSLAMMALVRRQNIFLQQTILPLKEMTFELQHADSTLIDPELYSCLHSVSEHILQIIDSAGMLSQINAGLITVLISGNDTICFVADVKNDLIFLNADDCPFYNLSIVDCY